MLDIVLGKLWEVFWFFIDLIVCDNCFCVFIYFLFFIWVILLDGIGRLYVIGIGECGNSVFEKWEIMFNEEFGDFFIIIYSILLLNVEEYFIVILFFWIEKEELDMKGSGFYVFLEWVIISKKN